MTDERLFHFSDDPSIERFVPRPVDVPSDRPGGMEWLNGPLVWAVAERRQATYLFPRDCPRVLLWCTDDTTPEDREHWWGDRACSMLAHMEWRWLPHLRSTVLHRYELPSASFAAVDADWMWVSHEPVVPTSVEPIDDLLDALAGERVELRVMESLAPLRGVWNSTLHASGIRLRHAIGWPAGEPPHVC